MGGSSSYPTQTRSLAGGASVRTSLKWTMRNWVVVCDIIMIKTLFTKPRENDMCIGSFVIFITCWDTRRRNCSKPAISNHRKTRMMSEAVVIIWELVKNLILLGYLPWPDVRHGLSPLCLVFNTKFDLVESTSKQVPYWTAYGLVCGWTTSWTTRHRGAERMFQWKAACAYLSEQP